MGAVHAHSSRAVLQYLQQVRAAAETGAELAQRMVGRTSNFALQSTSPYSWQPFEESYARCSSGPVAGAFCFYSC
ncbi:MAG: hypothetical protein QOD95_411 [Gammaproteobacteria bacterium]|jgi:hypothetical protein|nr:hypothetical protein [Gammaproteobacteria bacterium]